MKYFITGADGQLGKAFKKVIPEKNSFFSNRKNLDITDKKEVIGQILSHKPDIVIHTAAYTAVDDCEKNRDLAFIVNQKGTENIVEACQKINATVVYISTDYIFNGAKKSAHKENDKPNPLSVYGKSKLAGEKAVQKLAKYYIIRTAWLFGDGKNFTQTIIELSKTKNELKIVNDQIGSPTYTKDLAKAIKKLLNKKAPFGIYNITNQGFCSWYELAKQIVKIKNLQTNIIPISSQDWKKIKPDSAQRPLFSVLSNKKINDLNIKLRPWGKALEEYLK